MVKLVGGGIAVIVLLLILYFLAREVLGDDSTPVNAESQFDGVHLCAPEQQAAATVQVQARAQDPIPAAERVTGVLFAQNDPSWGNEEYDHGTQQNIGCGRTIAQCGCAMTSLATVMSLYQVSSMPSGAQLTPSSLNQRLNEGARLTGEGWVSYGFVYGSVVWTTINELTKGAFESTETAIRFKSWGSGSEEEIRSELAAGRPVILEVPGHYIAAVALDGDEIIINDPAYEDRTTLRSYAGLVRSSRLFESSTDLRSMLITVPAHLRVQVRDEQGRTVGTVDSDDVGQGASQIPGASHRYEAAWRDPTCVESPPPPGAGVKTIFIPLPEDGRYTIEVFDPNGGDTAVAVHMHDASGNSTFESHEGGSSGTFVVDYDDGVEEEPPVTPTPEPTETPEPGETETPTATADAATPAPPTAVPPTMPPPSPTQGGVYLPIRLTPITVELREVGVDGGVCETRLTWSLTGDINAKATLFRNGASHAETGAGQITYSDPFAAGTWAYYVRGINAAGLQELTSPTVTVTPVCIRQWELEQHDNADCYATLYWHVLGNATGTVRLYHRWTNDGVLSAWTEIYDEALTNEPRSIDGYEPGIYLYLNRQYQMRVFTGGRQINSPIINGAAMNCAGS